MDETARGRPRAVVALAVFAVAFALACTLLSPRWETNDDVGMAMAAHGFGLAVAPTPALIYSNVLWGHLVQAIPSPAANSEASIATE